MKFRVGQGYDAHRLTDGRPLVLGGVRIPYEKGLAGHSDADVVVHAVIDAILGAAGLGDIGKHFPDDDPEWKDADSLELLKIVSGKVADAGWSVNNIDCTVVAQEPRLAGFLPEMRNNIARVLGLDDRQVNIKATTTEGMGFTGDKTGIESHAVATVFRG